MIDSAFLNLPSIEALFHSSTWKFQHSAYDEKQATLNGLLIPITARYNFDIDLILKKVDLADIAQRAKQRFFGETLFTTVGVQSVPFSSGLVSVQLERIVVDLGIGLAIGYILLLSTGMFAAVYFHSRLRNRPLNLARDPGSAATIASLLAYQAETCACFERTDRLSGNLLREALGSQRFSMRNGMLITESTNSNTIPGESLSPRSPTLFICIVTAETMDLRRNPTNRLATNSPSWMEWTSYLGRLCYLDCRPCDFVCRGA